MFVQRPHVPLALLAASSIAAACGPVQPDAKEGCHTIVGVSCAQLLDQAEAGKGDGASVYRGIVVRKAGNRTYMRIPLAETVGDDKKQLFDDLIDTFIAGIGKVNRTLLEQGANLEALTDRTGEAYADSYREVLKGVFEADVHEDLERELGDNYEVRELTTLSRYYIPQAYIAFLSTKFSANWGIGGGVSATVMVVAQPWLSVAIDHTLDEPKIVSRQYEVDSTLMGVPNVDIGGGGGGGAPVRLGGGVVFGPIDQPEDIAGFGLGLSGSFSLPGFGGGMGKLITVVKNPPLFIAMGGYSTGTAAGAELHGGAQVLLNFEDFIRAIKSMF